MRLQEGPDLAEGTVASQKLPAQEVMTQIAEGGNQRRGPNHGTDECYHEREEATKGAAQRQRARRRS